MESSVDGKILGRSFVESEIEWNAFRETASKALIASILLVSESLSLIFALITVNYAYLTLIQTIFWIYFVTE